MRRVLLLASLLLLLAGAAPAPRVPAPGSLPPLVFVSRRMPDAPGSIPGFGPTGRTLAPGGRLLVRTPEGAVRPLLSAGRLHDVAHPSVSWDGRTIVFAATAAPESAWRIWAVGADGRGLRPLTRGDRELDLAPLGDDPRLERYDDVQPCWLPDGRIVFASTREPQVDQRRGGPVTNLFVVRPDGSGLTRITSDRNGAESPSVDPRTGRVVYARWWTNRWRPSDVEPSGITWVAAHALTQQVVNQWHAVSIGPDGDFPRLAGGRPDDRGQQVAYQPLMLSDGSLVRVAAATASLDPDPGMTRLVVSKGTGDAHDLTPATRRACSPASLPDGRLLCSLTRGTDADFGLWIVDHRGRVQRVLDLPGTMELDAAVLAPRKTPPVIPVARHEVPPPLPTRRDELDTHVTTFRFDCMNVFAQAPVDAPFVDAPRVESGLRIRFFTTLTRPTAAGGDSAVMIMEVPIAPWGGVHVDDLPADVPMFEQLVDARGHVVSTGAGPAHGTGSSANRLGTGTRCVGCHLGHSLLPVPDNNESASWVNLAPSATVTSSGAALGTELRAMVDRRARGATRTAWNGADESWLRLSWPAPVEVREVALYGTGAACEAILERDGATVATLGVAHLTAGGTRIRCAQTRLDAIRIRPRSRGVSLTEVEVAGRSAAPGEVVLR